MTPSTTRPAARAPEVTFLLNEGCPSMVRGYGSARGVLSRPAGLLISVLVWALAVVVAVVLIQEEGDSTPSTLFWVLPLVVLAVAYLTTALGLNRVLTFAVRWFFRSLVIGGSGVLHVLPLLLVAVTFFFLGAETWQSIGRLTGLPLVLTILLLGALTVGFLLRRGRADIDDLSRFDDEDQVRAALPEHLRPAGRIRYAETPLHIAERVNLLAVGLFGKLLVAVVVGLAIAAFFVIFGLLTVDLETVRSWVATDPKVLWHVTFAAHTYTLTSEHLRVSMFLGAFSALYFVVSSASDVHLARSLADDTDRHLRTCLAVRAVYLAAPERP